MSFRLFWCASAEVEAPLPRLFQSKNSMAGSPYRPEYTKLDPMSTVFLPA